MSKFPQTREEQLRLMGDPRTAHLARPADGADPELERWLESLKTSDAAQVIETEWTPDLMGKLTGRAAK